MWQPPRSNARLEFCCQNLRIHSQLHLSHGREPGGEHEELFPGLFPSQIPPSCFHSSDRDANQTHLAWSCSLFQKKVLLGGRKYPTLAWGGKQIPKNFLPPTSFLPFLNTLEQNVTTAAPAPDSCENTSCNRNENKVKTNQGKKNPKPRGEELFPGSAGLGISVFSWEREGLCLATIQHRVTSSSLPTPADFPRCQTRVLP